MYIVQFLLNRLHFVLSIAVYMGQDAIQILTSYHTGTDVRFGSSSYYYDDLCDNTL